MRWSKRENLARSDMKINELYLQNFNRFKEATFRFHPDFTVLIGNNATGKTTILDALCVALNTYLKPFDVVTGRGDIRPGEIRINIYEKKTLRSENVNTPLS